jgi:hypothetical protein
MKMLVISRMAWLTTIVSFAANAQLATNVTLTNLQGRVYRNITIDHTNALGVIWVAPDGTMGQFKFTDLPMEWWDRLNPTLAGQYREAVALKQEQEREAKALQAEAARLQAEAAKNDAEAQAGREREVQDALSATNAEEEAVNAMAESPTNMTADEKSARDSILKAMLDISSATSVGVARNDYGNLLAKATSALEFGKTKLSTERHEKYLACANKALHFYSKANDDWADYFKYDWEQEKDETMMSASDFANLRRNGLLVDASKYTRTSEDRSMFYVPFKESLDLYWQAADIYVRKMQSDQQQ